MFQNIISFLVGVYVGQEFGQQIPNVKDKTIEIYKEFQKTEFFNNYLNNKKK
jgi:hypothetical protein